MSAAPETDAGVLAGPDVAGRVVRGGVLRVIAFAVVNLLGVAGSVVLLRYLGVVGLRPLRHGDRAGGRSRAAWPTPD